MDYETSRIMHDDSRKNRDKWDEKFLHQMVDGLIEVEKAQNAFTRMVYNHIQTLLGKDKMLTFKFPIQTYGDYGNFKQIAFVGGILMSNNHNGWCDKPVQAYSGMYEHYMDMATQIAHGQYELSDNPHKDLTQDDLCLVV